MKIPEWLQPTLTHFEGRTDPFMEVEIGEAIASSRRKKGDIDQAELKVSLAEHSAFMFMERADGDSVWGTYFAPIFEGTRANGERLRMPEIEDLDGETVAHWKERANDSKNPLMRARYADCVWDLGRAISAEKPPHEFTRIAAQAYLDATESGLYKNEINGTEWLARALSIGRSINDRQLVSRAVDAILKFRDDVFKPKDVGVWIAPFDLLYEGKGLLSTDQESKIIDDLEAVLGIASSRTDGHFDPFGAQAAAERLSKHYNRKGQRDQVHRVIRAYGRAFESIAKEASPMLATAWLQPVIERYEQEGLNVEADEAQLLSIEKGKHIANDLKQYGVEIKVEQEDLDGLVEKLFSAGNLVHSLKRIAHFFIPSVASAEQIVQEIRTVAPLTRFIGVQIVDQAGRITARIGSVDEDAEGRLCQQLATSIGFHDFFLGYAIQELKDRFSPRVEGLLNAILESPVFLETQRPFLNDGLKAYLNGDFLKAIHVLVPQVEQALRNVLALIRVSPYKTVRRYSGISDVKSMGNALEDQTLRSVLPENVWRYLTVLYVDRRGINLRNNLAHGLVSHAAFTQTLCDRVFHSLLVFSLIRANPGNNPET
jgi:Domain of unknown function (DUF4209)